MTSFAQAEAKGADRNLSIAVVGLGVTGLTCATILARRGHRVDAYDARQVGGNHQSSHGPAKILRVGSQDPYLSTLATAATTWWEDLARISRTPLLAKTGVRYYAAKNSIALAKTVHSLEANNQPYYFEAEGPRSATSEVCAVESNAGLLFPKHCLTALKLCAQDLGVRIYQGREVRAVRATEAFVALTLPDEVLTYDRAVIAAGPWTPHLLKELRNKLRVTRQYLVRVRSRSSTRGAPQPWIDLERSYYGVLDLDDDTHVLARHLRVGDSESKGGKGFGECTPDDDVDPGEQASAAGDAVRVFMERFHPTDIPAILDIDTCHYTDTVSGRFIIDRLPGNKNVVVLSACSGVGFKFAPISGLHAALMAELTETKAPGEESLSLADLWSFTRF